MLHILELFWEFDGKLDTSLVFSFWVTKWLISSFPLGSVQDRTILNDMVFTSWPAFDEMELKLRSSLLADSPATKKYADVYVHVSFKKTVKRFKAHKFVLAQHSQYFDNIFLCNDSMPLVHVCFLSVHPDIVEDALKLMYGNKVEIDQKHLAKFEDFLTMLDVTYDSEKSLKDTNKNIGTETLEISSPPVNSSMDPPSIDVPVDSDTQEINALKREKSPEKKQTKKRRKEQS